MRSPWFHNAALLALPLLALPACSAGGSAGPEPAANAEAGSTASCALYARDAQLDVSFAEEPRLEAEYDTGLFARTLRVTRQEDGAHRRIDRWTTVLHYDAGATRGELHLETVVPWRFTALEGKTLSWENQRAQRACGNGGEEGEPLVIAEDVLRDEAGQLLFLGVLSAPTSPDGAVLLTPELTPELSVRWVDAGCQPAEAPGGGMVRPVALQIRAGDQSFTAPVGARTPIQVRGKPYMVAVSAAAIGAEGQCQSAAFQIYREGAIERVKDQQQR